MVSQNTVNFVTLMTVPVFIVLSIEIKLIRHGEIKLFAYQCQNQSDNCCGKDANLFFECKGEKFKVIIVPCVPKEIQDKIYLITNCFYNTKVRK